MQQIKHYVVFNMTLQTSSAVWLCRATNGHRLRVDY